MDRTRRAAPRHRAPLDGDALGLEVSCDRIERRARDQADVAGPGGRRLGRGLNLGSGLMQIDLLAAKGERRPALAEAGLIPTCGDKDS